MLTNLESSSSSVELKSYWLAEYMGVVSESWYNNGIQYKTREDATSYNDGKTTDANGGKIRRRVSKITTLKESFDE